MPIALRVNPCHYQINEKQFMYEFKKALWMVLLSTPVLIGLNDLADSVAAYPDKATLIFPEKPMHKQAYDTGTDSFH